MIRIEIEGAGRLTAYFDEIEGNILDLEKAGAWQAVSDILSEEFATLFEKEGGSPQWSRLKPSTVKKRISLKQTPIRIGWARGRMAQSLIDPRHPGGIEIRRPQEFIRGTSVNNNGVSYPSVFEHGRPGQAARPIMGRIFAQEGGRVVRRIGDAIERAVFDA